MTERIVVWFLSDKTQESTEGLTNCQFQKVKGEEIKWI